MRCVGIVGIIRGGGRARYFGHQLYLGGVYDGVSVEEGALEGGIHKHICSRCLRYHVIQKNQDASLSTDYQKTIDK
jgi:hypothetical protein